METMLKLSEIKKDVFFTSKSLRRKLTVEEAIKKYIIQLKLKSYEKD